MKLFIYRRGEWSTAIILSWWHPLELFLVRSALFFSFMKKKDPYLQTSIDHKNIDSWRETKKKKLSPSENVMSCKKIFALFKLYTFSSPFRAFSLRFQSFSDEPIRGSHHPDVSFHWYYVLTYRLKTFISLCWIAPRKGSIQSSIPETQIRTWKVKSEYSKPPKRCL